MTRPIETLAQRLKYARKMRGMTQEELAEKSDMKQPDISKIEKGLIVQTTGIARLAQALWIRAAWLEQGVGEEPNWSAGPVSASDRGVAHDMSLSVVIVNPAKIAWDDLMTADLSKPFTLTVQDDAMAPFLERGAQARFDPSRPPVPGRPVLLVDADGHHYIRHYHQKRPGHWQAVAEAPGYGVLDSVTDGLRVVAPMTGFDWA